MTPGATQYEYHLDGHFFADMESADIHDADLDVKLTVTLKDDIYNLDFAVTGTITLLCDRCLDSLTLPVDTTYSIAVEYGDDYNDESDTLLTIPSSDAFLNVAYMLYDTVALTVPIKHVHPAGQCNRMMSSLLNRHRAADIDGEQPDDDTIGYADDNESDGTSPDPRWDALRKLNDNN